MEGTGWEGQSHLFSPPLSVPSPLTHSSGRNHHLLSIAILISSLPELQVCLCPAAAQVPILAQCAQCLIFALTVLTCPLCFLGTCSVGTEPMSSWAVRRVK